MVNKLSSSPLKVQVTTPILASPVKVGVALVYGVFSAMVSAMLLMVKALTSLALVMVTLIGFSIAPLLSVPIMVRL